MKNILESIQNIYAMKLVNWQMKGRDEEVNQCMKAIRDFDWLLERDRLFKDENGILHGSVNIQPITQDVKNWIFGYYKARGCIRVETGEIEYFYKNEQHTAHLIAYAM